MNNKRKAFIVILVLVVGLVLWLSNRGSDLAGAYVATESEVEEPEWEVTAAVPEDDTAGIVLVRYQEKYGQERDVRCMAVFENQKQYKLVGPEIGSLVIEKANLVSLRAKRVQK